MKKIIIIATVLGLVLASFTPSSAHQRTDRNWAAGTGAHRRRWSQKRRDGRRSRRLGQRTVCLLGHPG